MPSLGRVLVVDDEPEVGATLQEMLTELGYVVKHVRSGAEALQLAPVLDHLRRDHRDIPVVILSGNQDLGTARRTLRSGAFDYVPKPFTIDILARVVAAAAAMPRRGPRGL